MKVSYTLLHKTGKSRKIPPDLRFERHTLDGETPKGIAFAYKGPIIDDEKIHCQRIIHRHALDAFHGGTANG
jgi:hypothetical protein